MIDENSKYRDSVLVRIIILCIVGTFIFAMTSSIIFEYIDFYEFKMSRVRKKHPEVTTEFNTLHYKMPEDYILTVYEEDYSRLFTSKNDNYHCNIDIYHREGSYFSETINTCDYYDINNNHISDEERLINDKTWCYRQPNDSHESYYINNGKDYYSIELFKYNNVEKCLNDFSNFLDSVRIE